MKNLTEKGELQRIVEDILIKARKTKFEVTDFPTAANLLKCNIMYNCPYTYERLLINPEDKNAKHTIVISMDSPNILKLYLKEESVESSSYSRERIELKEKIIAQLVDEYEKILMRKPVSKADFRLDSIIDQLVKLKSAKIRSKSEPSNLLIYLEELKKENKEIATKLLSFEPKEDSIEEYKLPCMCCKNYNSVTELSCGHTVCSDYLIDISNQKKSEHKAFVPKCPVPSCFYIIASEELKDILRESLADKISIEASVNTPEDCLFCQKPSNVNIHDEHSLCDECLLGYVRYVTDSEMIMLDTNTKRVIPIKCPMPCRAEFDYKLYRRLIKDDLLKEKLGESDRKPSKSNIKGCYECGLSTNVARLHLKCNLYFCSNHYKELGKKVYKNKSILIIHVIELCIECGNAVDTCTLAKLRTGNCIEYSSSTL